MSKAFGVIGGVIGGSQLLIDYLKQKARPFLFSTGLSVPDTAALIEVVDILSGNSELVEALWKNGEYLKSGFKKMGFDIGVSETPITPVMLGDEDLAKKFSQRLFEFGVFATPIVFPMVAKGKARIRVMPSACMKKEDLDFGLEQFGGVGKELGVI